MLSPCKPNLHVAPRAQHLRAAAENDLKVRCGTFRIYSGFAMGLNNSEFCFGALGITLSPKPEALRLWNLEDSNRDLFENSILRDELP